MKQAQPQGGYIGKGVNVETIQLNFSEFLIRQSTLAGAMAAVNVTRADELKQLEGIFEGGATGLGASINDMLKSIADVASAPTDMTACTVTLTRIDETALRLRAASPNDLLNRRDQLVRELNHYLQTTSIPADGRTISIFLGVRSLWCWI